MPPAGRLDALQSFFESPWILWVNGIPGLFEHLVSAKSRAWVARIPQILRIKLHSTAKSFCDDCVSLIFWPQTSHQRAANFEPGRSCNNNNPHDRWQNQNKQPCGLSWAPPFYVNGGVSHRRRNCFQWRVCKKRKVFLQIYKTHVYICPGAAPSRQLHIASPIFWNAVFLNFRKIFKFL